MPPVAGRRGRVTLYLALWLLIGGLLATLLAAQGTLGWGGALVVALPLAAAYSFVCISSWYVARATPVGESGGVAAAPDSDHRFGRLRLLWQDARWPVGSMGEYRYRYP